VEEQLTAAVEVRAATDTAANPRAVNRWWNGWNDIAFAHDEGPVTRRAGDHGRVFTRRQGAAGCIAKRAEEGELTRFVGRDAGVVEHAELLASGQAGRIAFAHDHHHAADATVPDHLVVAGRDGDAAIIDGPRQGEVAGLVPAAAVGSRRATEHGAGGEARSLVAFARPNRYAGAWLVGCHYVVIRRGDRAADELRREHDLVVLVEANQERHRATRGCRPEHTGGLARSLVAFAGDHAEGTGD